MKKLWDQVIKPQKDSLGMPSNEEINRGIASALPILKDANVVFLSLAKSFKENSVFVKEMGKALQLMFDEVVIPCGAVSRMDKRQKRRYKRLAQNG